MSTERPRRVLVRAGGGLPLHLRDEPGGPFRAASAAEAHFGLPAVLAGEVDRWSAAWPQGDFPDRAAARQYAEQGRRLAAQVAARLGAAWLTSYYHPRYRTSLLVCHVCGGAHRPHGAAPDVTAPGPLVVRAEYRDGGAVLRSGEHWIAPDDPVPGLALDEDTVEELYAWSRAVTDLVDYEVLYRPPSDDTPWQALQDWGEALSARVADELPDWHVAYGGAHTGLPDAGPVISSRQPRRPLPARPPVTFGPRDVLVRAGQGFLLHADTRTADCDELDPHRALTPDELGLSVDLAEELRSWAGSRPPGGRARQGSGRESSRRGARVCARLAASLDPDAWTVRFYDEARDRVHPVCPFCGAFHPRVHHIASPAPAAGLVMRWSPDRYPLYDTAGQDFAPDDPVADLGLSDALADGVYAWSDAVADLFADVRDEVEEGARTEHLHEPWAALEQQGRALAERLDAELPRLRVEYRPAADPWRCD